MNELNIKYILNDSYSLHLNPIKWVISVAKTYIKNKKKLRANVGNWF
jgi:hypothetical protein